jgi:hypothetical protein
MRASIWLFLGTACGVYDHADAVISNTQVALGGSPNELALASTVSESPRLRGAAESVDAAAGDRMLAAAAAPANSTNATSTSDDDFITAYIWNYRPYVIPVLVCGILFIIIIALCILASCGITPDIIFGFIFCPFIVLFEGCIHCMSCMDPSVTVILCCWCFLICPDKKPKPKLPNYQMQMQDNPQVQQPGVVKLAPGAASWGTPSQQAPYQQPPEIPVARAVDMPGNEPLAAISTKV